MIKTAKQAIAHHLNMDFADLGHYEYCNGCYTRTVYVVGNDYYCATKGNPAFPIDSRMSPIEWEQKETIDGWKVFHFESNEREEEVFDTEKELSGVELANFFLLNLAEHKTLGRPRCDIEERRKVLFALQNAKYIDDLQELTALGKEAIKQMVV